MRIATFTLKNSRRFNETFLIVQKQIAQSTSRRMYLYCITRMFLYSPFSRATSSWMNRRVSLIWRARECALICAIKSQQKPSIYACSRWKQSIMRRERERKYIARYCVTFTVCLQTPDQTLTVNRSSRWFSFSREFISDAFVFMWKKKRNFLLPLVRLTATPGS